MSQATSLLIVSLLLSAGITINAITIVRLTNQVSRLSRRVLDLEYPAASFAKRYFKEKTDER